MKVAVSTRYILFFNIKSYKTTFIMSTDKTSTEFTMRKEMHRSRSTLRIAPTDGCLNIWLPDPTHVRDTPTVY